MKTNNGDGGDGDGGGGGGGCVGWWRLLGSSKFLTMWS